MAKRQRIERLTERRIERLTEPGRYSDAAAPTLSLLVAPGGSKSWSQRVVIAGKGEQAIMGLGGYPFVSIDEARELAHNNRKLAKQGIDPRVKPEPTPLFRKACELSAPTDMVDTTVAMRQSALDRYAGRLMDRPIDTIGREDVLRVLTPIWTDKHNIAKKVRGWMRGAFAWGIGHGHIDTNYADVIEGALPKVTSKEQHHGAVEYDGMPNVLQMVSDADASESVKACLAFVILTACRSGESREASWSEIDFQAATWTIPADRTKTRKAHIIPLSDAALAILTARRGDPDDDGPIFPGRSGRKPISRAAMSKLLEKIVGEDGGTVHGMRSAFRTWAENETVFDFHVLEACLAHETKSSVQKAYARGDMLAKRRTVMNAWADHATGRQSSKVVQFAAG